MRRTMLVLASVSVAILALGSAQAQPAPDSENGRYSFSAVPDGMLRLDTRTGAISFSRAARSSGTVLHAQPAACFAHSETAPVRVSSRSMPSGTAEKL